MSGRPTAVVTGCSTGIGHATALRLAEDGYHVVATMRDPSSSDLAADAIEVRALDVTDATAVEHVIASVLAEHDRIDVLVNNAGIQEGGAIEETDLDAFRRVMETNFFASLACTKAVLPAMRERGSGAIVNVTSQAGVLAMPAMGAYCASKWALEAASEVLALEVWPFGVRVAIIEPGTILTPIWSKVDLTPPTGPYAPVRNRLGASVMAELPHASSADEVADCIAHAIATDEPKLRWLVGRGAQRNVAVSASMSFEHRADLWHHADQSVYLQAMGLLD